MEFETRFDLKKYGAKYEKSFLIFTLADNQEIIEHTKLKFKVAKELEALEDVDDIDVIAGKTEEVVKVQIDFIKKHFVSGRIYDSKLKEDRDATKKDITKLPPTIVRELVDVISGRVGK